MVEHYVVILSCVLVATHILFIAIFLITCKRVRVASARSSSDEQEDHLANRNNFRLYVDSVALPILPLRAPPPRQSAGRVGEPGRAGKTSEQICDLVESMKKNDVRKSIKEETCPICLDTLLNLPMAVGKCDHCFHVGCISKWLSQASTEICPVCRSNLVV